MTSNILYANESKNADEFVQCTAIVIDGFFGSDDRFGSTGAISGSPTKKCPGVRTRRSLGSFEAGHKGLELRQASILAKTVYISSKLRLVSPTTRLKCRLTDLTLASHKPPNVGERGGIKCHEILHGVKASVTF
jgi:hypothetical protein